MRYWAIVLPLTVAGALAQLKLAPGADPELAFLVCFLVCNVASFLIFWIMGWSLKTDNRRGKRK
jgi:hypothetical protein